MKHARILFLYLLAAVTVLYARFAQMRYLTEADSGFWKSDTMPEAIALTVFIAVAVVTAAGLSLLCRRHPCRAPEKTPPLCFGAVALSLSFLWEALFVDYITNAVTFVNLTRLFAALSAVSMMAFALSPIIERTVRLPRLIFICPTLFFLFKLISVFTVYATVSVIASNVFFLLYLCAALFFFLLFGKLENSFSGGRAAKLIYPTVIVGSIAALCCVIPQSILLLSNLDRLVHESADSFVCCLGFTVFSVIYLLELYKKPKTV